MNDKSCINCIHKDVCFRYRLNYAIVSEGNCTNYYENHKKVKWIHKDDMDYLDENQVAHIHFMCEKCGFIHDFIDVHTSQYCFCPSCGADMRETGNREDVPAQLYDIVDEIDNIAETMRGD